MRFGRVARCAGGAMLAVAGAALTAGCELQEVTVVDFADVVVAEVYVTLRDAPSGNEIQAFLHGTEAGSAPSSRTFEDAVVTVTRGDGGIMDLELGPVDRCVASLAEGATGTCFLADPNDAAGLEPSDELALEIVLPDGQRALGALRIPGPFELTELGSECRLAPGTTAVLRWTRSTGAWAYANETLIRGLPDALAAEGIQADDPLYLLGLSVSAADTTVVFPSEFGVFDRFDLDQDLAVRLQSGLPDDTDATITIAALEQNYVNWVRGGTFNPSGQVRVSSLRGAATGVFGAAVVRELVVYSSAGSMPSVPDCP